MSYQHNMSQGPCTTTLFFLPLEVWLRHQKRKVAGILALVKMPREEMELLPPRGVAELNKRHVRGAWVAQSVKLPTSAPVMISRFVSSSPVLGSVLTVRSLLGILSLPLSLPLPWLHSLSFSLSKIRKH